MDAAINYLQRDAGSLIKTVNLNRTSMEEGGFSEESYTFLNTAAENLALKVTECDKAEKQMQDSTKALNATIAETRQLISDVKSCAKSAYGKDQRILNLFKVGDKVPESVNNLIPQSEYFNSVVQERKDVLLKNGLTPAKVSKMGTAAVDLKNSDDTQENAKKLRKSCIIQRDTAVKVLNEEMFKVRNFAKACFSGKQEILVQFKPIPKGRGGTSSGEETPPENPPANPPS